MASRSAWKALLSLCMRVRSRSLLSSRRTLRSLVPEPCCRRRRPPPLFRLPSPPLSDPLQEPPIRTEASEPSCSLEPGSGSVSGSSSGSGAARGKQYLIKQVDHDIILEGDTLPLFSFGVTPTQHFIVAVTGFQTTFMVVEMVPDGKLIPNMITPSRRSTVTFELFPIKLKTSRASKTSLDHVASRGRRHRRERDEAAEDGVERCGPSGRQRRGGGGVEKGEGRVPMPDLQSPTFTQKRDGAPPLGSRVRATACGSSSAWIIGV
ncbi:hypothetical protein EYF80_040067 [Liparis tanakae]|uniref:Uncharacterized protein n=1 Tax=Liparis tanakae TaxID=230148 RepID=A0A4Z2G890_9TELE|nr:hypothetical protein EYF80_040067 [Liparis tanakae]